MGAVLLAPLYIILNIYLFTRMLLWFSTLHSFLGSVYFAVPFLVCCAVIAVTPLFAAFGKGRVKTVSKLISNFWIGILTYMLIFLLMGDLLLIIYCLVCGLPIFTPVGTGVYRVAGGLIFGSPAALSYYGIRHAAHIKTARYEAVISKDCPLPSLKIALAADLHLGYTVGIRHLLRLRAAIDAMQPDLVIFAGDIFDNEFDAVQQPGKAAGILKSIHSTYGSYACWGNHDIEEVILAGFTFASGDRPVTSDPRMNRFLKKSGIRLLEDETVLIDRAFYLTGRLDVSCREKSGCQRLTPEELFAGLDSSRPLLVIDHQPAQLRELSVAGADLTLSGHTHDGQMFPGNLTTRIGWLNSYGKLVLGRMTSIVTSGAGTWGPAMRIGTDSEVAEITVTFDA